MRERPNIPEQYVEKSVIIGNIQAHEASLMRKFLGAWYFDVLVWTFNEDGTGLVDIPELGDQPATQKEFSYSLSGDITNMLMELDWTDDTTAYFWPTLNTDGSITLKNANDTQPIKLTRTFDIDNCPISEQIISAGMGVFSGSIFSDILGGE